MTAAGTARRAQEDSAAVDAAAADAAAIAARYPRAFASDGTPLWKAGGVVSTPREAQIAFTVGDALPLLLALWWVALSLRALAADRRRRAPVIALAGALGAFACARFAPWAVVWFMAGLDDRYGVGPALLGALTLACAATMVTSWGIADPRKKSAPYLPAPVVIGTEGRTAPTVPAHLRPGLFALSHWTLAGTALGLLVVGVAYGYFFDGVRPGLPERLALGIAALGAAAGLLGAARARG